jgi:hypothetical protein
MHADGPSVENDILRGYGDPNAVNEDGAVFGLIECMWC